MNKVIRWLLCLCVAFAPITGLAQPSVPVMPSAASGIKPRVDPAKHILAAGDVLEFVLDINKSGAKSDEVPRNFAVRVDGNVELPVVGELTVAGQKLPQIEKIIAARLRKKLRNPGFRLGLLSAAPVQVVVLGEVKTPGRYDIAPGSGVQEALAVAGGFTPLADRRAVLIQDSSTGKTNVVAPPARPEDQIALKNADVIYVLAGKKINVLGEVFNPGQYALSAETGSPQEALTAAGGAKPTAALQRAVVFRPSTSQSFPVKLVGQKPINAAPASPSPSQQTAIPSAESTPAPAPSETTPSETTASPEAAAPPAPLETQPTPAATPTTANNVTGTPLWTTTANGSEDVRMQEGDILIVPPRQAVVICQSPKAVPLLGGENLMDVVTQAGVSTEVKLDDIRIVRNGGTAVEHVNLKDYLEKQDRSALVAINDGDIIVMEVPQRGGLGGMDFISRIANALLNPFAILQFIR